MTGEREFFRTKIWLENGERFYVAANHNLVYRAEEKRTSVEAVQRRTIAHGELAFSQAIGDVRPTWSLPTGDAKSRVVGFDNEPESAPIDASAHLTSGENVSDTTGRVYLS
jgi:hypothetical protein